MDRAIPGRFYQYDRLALAEAAIEREGDRYLVSTYLEFRRRYEKDPADDGLFSAARAAVQAMDANDLSALLNLLEEIAVKISSVTHLPSGLQDAGQRTRIPAGATFEEARTRPPLSRE